MDAELEINIADRRPVSWSSGVRTVNLELYFGPDLIGVIEGAFCSDNTGYGVFQSAGSNSPDARRVREYVAFSEEWHERLRSDRPHDAAEFDAFRDVHESGQWRTVAPDGTVSPVSGPVFVDGEITWRPSPGA